MEEIGLDTVWLSDHLLQCDPSADSQDPMLEAYTTLGWLAAKTSRVRLRPMPWDEGSLTRLGEVVASLGAS